MEAENENSAFGSEHRGAVSSGDGVVGIEADCVPSQQPQQAYLHHSRKDWLQLQLRFKWQLLRNKVRCRSAVRKRKLRRTPEAGKVHILL